MECYTKSAMKTRKKIYGWTQLYGLGSHKEGDVFHHNKIQASTKSDDPFKVLEWINDNVYKTHISVTIIIKIVYISLIE